MTYLDYAQIGFIIIIVVIGVGGLIKVALLDKD
jgi:hypothetical protein